MNISSDALAHAKAYVNRHQEELKRSGGGFGGFQFELVRTTVGDKAVNVLYCHALGLLIYPDGISHPFPDQARPQLPI